MVILRKKREIAMIKEILKARWVEVVDIFRVESANINAGEGGPAEIDVKTIHLEDGTVVPRISSQAIFRMIRDYWIDKGEKVDIAREEPGKPAPLPKCDPKEFIDDDLFGYLMARRGEASERGISEARPGPIRSTGAMGLFEYPDDTDFTTSIISPTEKAGGAMVTRRLYTNTFILPIWCDVKRVGKEVVPQKDKSLRFENFISDNQRERRMRLFFESLFYLGKFAPGAYKPPLPPKLMMIGIFSKPNIMLYDALQNDLTIRLKEVRLQKEIDERKNEERIVSIASGKIAFSIEPNSLIERMKFYKNDIIKIRIGIFESLFEKDASKLQEEMRDKLDDNLRGKITVSDLATFKDDILK
ncbi:MAG: type I-B CRISPR-associated protein Cas7/Cst2/DevR [Candidatus Cloacimonas sp. 4484_209]|nr:MAG: type I-B CRISPR-associated protein Cas7/Cst2/DevR [Candidatus Cloacimonas sp. 4484_209]